MSIHRPRWTFVSGALLSASAIVVFASALRPSQTADRTEIDPTVARVGSYSITQASFSARCKIEEIYYPGGDHELAALAHLLKGYLAAEILALRGSPIGRSELEQDAARIDRKTRVPETLAKIKNVFGGDRNSYLDTFVLPQLAQSSLTKAFFDDASLDAQRRAAVSAAVERLQAGEDWQAVTSTLGAGARPLAVSRWHGIGRPAEIPRGRGAAESIPRPVPSLPEATPSSVREALAPTQDSESRSLAAWYLDSFLPGIQQEIGRVGVVESRDGFGIVRLRELETDWALCDVVTVDKRSYGDYFFEMAERIDVDIYGDELRRRFVDEVAWARRLALEKGGGYPPPPSQASTSAARARSPISR